MRENVGGIHRFHRMVLISFSAGFAIIKV